MMKGNVSVMENIQVRLYSVTGRFLMHHENKYVCKSVAAV
jgi:hypothetical protein